MSAIIKYRAMWMMVLFDLPTETDEDRKTYTRLSSVSNLSLEPTCNKIKLSNIAKSKICYFSLRNPEYFNA